jgi:1-acyl-sn-glycerol-3-phosphate acyltransferase
MRPLANPKNWKLLGIGSLDLARIVLSNVGLLKSEPNYKDVYDHCTGLFGLLWNTRDKLLIRNGENIVRQGSAIYVANHIRKSDALSVAYTVYTRTQGRQLRIMMRDDFFGDRGWSKTRLLDLDRLAVSFGAIQVSRQAGAYSQMKRFIDVLLDGGCFIIFPTGTRSRSGHVMELPPPLELGTVSFFAAMAQRKASEKARPVAMVPTGISFDPVSKRMTLVFGESRYLAIGSPDRRLDREALSEFDVEIVRAASRLVEINLVHLCALYLLNWVWHSGELRKSDGHGVRVERSVLIEDLAEIVSHLKSGAGLCLGDSLDSELEPQLRRVERFFASKGMIRISGNELLLRSERILSAPSLDHDYRKRNPVKYLANQIAHFDEIVSAVEERVLRNVGARR